MTDWVRLWHDMPTDPKWRTIARKSGQRVGDVMAVFNFMMVNASVNAAERGTLSGFDVEDVATALDIDDDDVRAIIAAMQGKVLDGDRLTGWERRQPKREDGTAAKRKAEWKERQRNATERNGTHGNAPETETETDITPLPPLQGEKRATPKRKTALPADWQPDDFGDGADCQRIVTAWPAHERQRQITKFTAHHVAKGSRMADWQAAWKTWVLNSEQFGRPAPHGGDGANFARIGARRATGPPVAVAAE